MATAQSDIDALTTQATAQAAKSAAQDAIIKNVETEVAALEAANPGLDISGLKAALAGTDTAQATEDTDLNTLNTEAAGSPAPAGTAVPSPTPQS